MDLHLVGGFLGSGKTTAIIHAARILTQRGNHVGIITNEQGKHLVDTGFIHSLDMPALEVTGGCICCNLDDFEARIDEINGKFNPQVIFAESVGSCTDLVATVIKPLSDFRKTSAEPTSLSVFTDSRLLLRHLRRQEMPFSDAVMYIFEKQIEETDLLIINKIDLLPKADAEAVLNLAKTQYPNKLVRPQNSLDKVDILAWMKLIESRTTKTPDISIDIDYNIYAAGEKRFCWLDRVLEIQVGQKNSGAVTAKLIEEIFQQLTGAGGKIAHLKILVITTKGSQKINMTAMDEIEVIRNLADVRKLAGSPISLTINAMIEGDLDTHSSALDNIINTICMENEVSCVEKSRFDRVPGFPKPTMRIGN